MIIRAATNRDLPAWATLRHALWPECAPERHRLEMEQLLVAKDSGLIAVAAHQRELVGFAEVSLRRDHVPGTSAVPVPYLEGWYVREDFRRQGIGRALLVFVEAWSLQRGFQELASDAESANQIGIHLHARLGFREVERTVHFVKSLAAPSNE